MKEDHVSRGMDNGHVESSVYQVTILKTQFQALLLLAYLHMNSSCQYVNQVQTLEVYQHHPVSHFVALLHFE